MGNALPCSTIRECLCLGAVRLSGFDPSNPNTYYDVMNNETINRYFATGEWIGIDAIAEYILWFGGDFGTELQLIHPGLIDMSYTTEEECVAVLGLVARVRTKLPYATNNVSTCIDASFGNVIKYQFTGKLRKPILISEWNIWSDNDFSTALFGALDTEESARYSCETIVDVCEEEGIDSSDTCLERWNELPASDDGIWIDGDSRYCRMLHGSYARENTFHCPHVTFTPEADGNGQTKCFESKRTIPEEYLTSGQIEILQTASVPYDSPNPNLVVFPDGNCPDVEIFELS